MENQHRFTEEEKVELLSNPYTARLAGNRVIFTLAFKQFVMKCLEMPGMTSRKIFHQAGYADSLFTLRMRTYAIESIRREAASPEGLHEPTAPKRPAAKKKTDEAEFRELQERVTFLEQQLQFLKKSQQLKKEDRFFRSDSSN